MHRSMAMHPHHDTQDIDIQYVRSLTICDDISSIDTTAQNRLNFSHHQLTSIEVVGTNIGWIDLPDTMERIHINKNNNCLSLRLDENSSLKQLTIQSNTIVHLIDSNASSTLRLDIMVLDIDDFICSAMSFTTKLILGPVVMYYPDNILCKYLRIMSRQSYCMLTHTMATMSPRTEGILFDIMSINNDTIAMPEIKLNNRLAFTNLKYIGFLNHTDASASAVKRFCKTHFVPLFAGQWVFCTSIDKVLYFENLDMNAAANSVISFLDIACE